MSIGATVERLVSARLALEPLRVSHADEMVSVLSHPRLYDWTGGSPPSHSELSARYRIQAAGSVVSGEEWFNWIVRTLDTDAPIGFVQATVTEWEADVAWVIGVDHQRRGFAVEAANAMVGWLNAHGVECFVAHIHPGHLESQGVAAAIGLSPTGEMDGEGEEIWCRPLPSVSEAAS